MQQVKIGYEDRLMLEAERVLGHSLFLRAPVQSILLRYLLVQTLAGGFPPTQREIAIEALRKTSEEYAKNPSYPRSQISQLRKNLETFYAQDKDNVGVQLCVEKADYRLALRRPRKPK